MPYDPSDARSALRSPAGPAAPAAPEPAAAADHVRFYDLPPADSDGENRTWYGRSQHLVIGYTDLVSDTTLSHAGGPDEHAVLLPDATTSASITIDNATVDVPGDTLTFLPPGAATIRLRGTGRVITVATTRSTGLAEKAANAQSYLEPHPNVAPFRSWPEPVDGFRPRTYSLDVPGLTNPPFRIFRCASFMINYTRPRSGPRDVSKMSPHAHDDFEQCSLVIEGEFVHHIRWPWTTDMTTWRPDEHEHCGSPSLTVIPPPTVHTSQAVGAGVNHLIDIFGPPREDFSRMDGWVLNADEYPMP